jgi:SWI/SNF-related matrix-associated actin-dependent regulator of chromatin subfamily A containing DEAD/H box 1
MNFILPETFGDQIEKLRAIFKVKGDSKIGLLSQERISRAKKMMTPFVLRRRKDQVNMTLNTRGGYELISFTGSQRSSEQA